MEHRRSGHKFNSISCQLLYCDDTNTLYLQNSVAQNKIHCYEHSQNFFYVHFPYCSIHSLATNYRYNYTTNAIWSSSFATHVTFMKLIMSPCKTARFAKSSDHVFLQILCAKASKYVLVAKHTAELAATDMV